MDPAGTASNVATPPPGAGQPGQPGQPSTPDNSGVVITTNPPKFIPPAETSGTGPGITTNADEGANIQPGKPEGRPTIGSTQPPGTPGTDKSESDAIDIKAIFGENNALADGWGNILAEKLGDDPRAEMFKDNETLKNIKDIPTLVKAFLDNKAAVGSEKVAKLGENATPEQVSQFYADAGLKPKSPEDYVFNSKEGYEISEERQAELRNMFYEENMSQSMVDRLVAHQEGMIEKLNTDAENARKIRTSETSEALVKQWGSAHDENVMKMNNWLNETGGMEFFESNIPWNQNAKAITWFKDRVIDHVSEELATIGHQETMSFNDAESERKKIFSDPNHPLHSKWLTQDPVAMKRVESLSQQIVRHKKAAGANR